MTIRNVRLYAAITLMFALGIAAGMGIQSMRKGSTPAPSAALQSLPESQQREHDESATRNGEAQRAASAQRELAIAEHSTPALDVAPSDALASDPLSLEERNAQALNHYLDVLQFPSAASGDKSYRLRVVDPDGTGLADVALIVRIYPEFMREDYESMLNEERSRPAPANDHEALRRLIEKKVGDVSAANSSTYHATSDSQGRIALSTTVEGKRYVLSALKEGWLLERSEQVDDEFRIVIKQALAVEFNLRGPALPHLSQIRLRWSLNEARYSGAYDGLPYSETQGVLELSTTNQIALRAGSYSVSVTGLATLNGHEQRIEVYENSSLQISEAKGSQSIALELHLPASIRITLKHPEGWSFRGRINSYIVDPESGEAREADPSFAFFGTGDDARFTYKRAGVYLFSIQDIKPQHFVREVELQPGKNELVIDLEGQLFRSILKLQLEYDNELYDGETSFNCYTEDAGGSTQHVPLISSRKVSSGIWEVISPWNDGASFDRLHFSARFGELGLVKEIFRSEPQGTTVFRLHEAATLTLSLTGEEAFFGPEVNATFFDRQNDNRAYARMFRNPFDSDNVTWSDVVNGIQPGVYRIAWRGNKMHGTVVTEGVKIKPGRHSLELSVPGFNRVEVILPAGIDVQSVYVEQRIDEDWSYQCGAAKFDESPLVFDRTPVGSYRVKIEWVGRDTPTYHPYEVTGPTTITVPAPE